MPNGFEYRGKRLVQKMQSFTSSGMFNPSRGLLEAGGIVDVYLIGGGESGAINVSGGWGGNAGQTIEGRVVVTGTSAVVIGAGGAATTGEANSGGSSSFGGLSAYGGSSIATDENSGGAGSGGSAPLLGHATKALRAPSGFCRSYYSESTSPQGGPPNKYGHGHGGNAINKANGTNYGSGGGGGTSGTSGAGGTGYCELTWWEYEQ